MKIKFMFIVFFLVPSLSHAAVATEFTQVLNNIQLVKQYYNQIQSLYNEASMIANQIEQLKSIATYKGSWSDFQAIWNKIDELRNRAQTIQNRLKVTYQDMRDAQDKLDKIGTYKQQQDNASTLTEAGFDSAMQTIDLQNQAMAQEAEELKALAAKSDNSQGETQALQTLNAYTSHLARQNMEIRQLIAAQMASQAAYANQEYQAKKKLNDSVDQIIHPIDPGESTYHIGDKI